MNKRLAAVLFAAICSLSPAKTAFVTEKTYSKGECVMEQSSRRILYASSSNTRLPIASTTKILTAITVLENIDDVKKEVIVPKEAERVEGSSVYLRAGDKYSVKSLLYGLMLRSGNDCATALALSVNESVEEFSTLMNLTAQKAGALDSNFVNPHGLHDEKHYSTAKDLCHITAYAMQNPLFCEIFSAKSYPEYGWANKNKLFSLYEPCIGGKTGYTTKAGKCLVSAAKKEGMTLICSVIDCPTTYERSIQLFEEAFSAYKMVELLKAEEKFYTSYGEGIVLEGFSFPLMSEEESLIEKRVIPLKSPLKRNKNGEIIAQLQILLVNQLLFSTNLYKL